MPLRATPLVTRTLSALRCWLKDAWLGRVPFLAWSRRLLCPRSGRWGAVGKPRRVTLALESVERRETPNDLFGLLGTPLLGTGLGLLGGPLLTPAAVLMNGWSFAGYSLAPHNGAASDGPRAPGLFSAASEAGPAGAAAPASPAIRSGPHSAKRLRPAGRGGARRPVWRPPQRRLARRRRRGRGRRRTRRDRDACR